MALPDARFGNVVVSIALAEEKARKRLREAEAAGADQATISELTSIWYDLLSTLLRSYAAPANWQRDWPQGVIPRDTARALGEQVGILTADLNISKQDDLASALASARQHFHRHRSGNSGGRKGATMALMALIKHAQATMPYVKESLEPLYHLAAALDELDKTGKVDPMLTPRRRSPGRPKEPPGSWLLKQAVAVAVEILMNDGLSEVAANDYVRRRLDRIGRATGRRTVDNWRTEVRQHLPRGEPGCRRPDLTQCEYRVREYLRVWYEWLDKKGEIASKTWVNALIDGVQSFAQVHAPKKAE